jgi:tetratricopeptide (TPR) repeat protein
MDYGALAQQFGGVSAPAAPSAEADVAADAIPAARGGAAKPDYATLAKQFGGVSETSEQTEIPWESVPLQALTNAPASAGKAVVGLAEMAVKPVSTAKSLLDLAAGGLREGVRKLSPEVFNFIESLDANPEAAKKASETAKALGGQLAEDYGSEKALKNTIATDPVKAFMDLSAVLSGGAGVVRRVPVVGAETTANALARAGELVDPLTGAIKGTAAVGDVVGRTGTKIGEAIFAPERTAANKLIDVGGAPDFINAMRATRDLPVTPGAPAATAAERMAAAGYTNPAFAGLEQGLINVNTSAGREAYNIAQQRAQAIQDQLGRIEAQIQQGANAMAPKATADLQTVRNELLTRLQQEQATLKMLGENVAGALPNTGQRVPGEALATRGEALRETAKKTEVEPAYRRAFDAAGDTPINVGNVVAKAEDILGRPLASFDPSTAPEIVRKLNALKGEAVPGEFVSLGERGGYTLPSLGAKAPTATLEQLDAMRKAVNNDIAAASASNASDATAKLRNLGQLHKVIDEAALKSGLPQEAKDLYNKAVGTYREEFVPKFKTGVIPDMMKNTFRNEPKLLPDNVTDALLSNETRTGQFIKTFSGDAAAAEAIKTGIADKFRESVVDKTTKLVDPAKADAFLKDYGRQIDMLEKAGINVKSTLQQAREQADKLKVGMDDLAVAAKKMNKPEDAVGLVSSALKSPVEMDFIYKRLGPDARSALAHELTERALAPIREGDSVAALKYLNENAKAIKAGLGSNGAKVHSDLVSMVKFQKNLSDVASGAVKPVVPTEVTLRRDYTPQELTDLKVVADEIARVNKVNDLAKAGRESAKNAEQLASEAARTQGIQASEIPSLMSRTFTMVKNAFKRNEARMNDKTTAALIDYMYKNPDKAAADMEAALARRAPSAPVNVPKAISSGFVAPPLTIYGASAPSENRNSMAR